jgi:hypothetical protein
MFRLVVGCMVGFLVTNTYLAKGLVNFGQLNLTRKIQVDQPKPAWIKDLVNLVKLVSIFRPKLLIQKHAG